MILLPELNRAEGDQKKGKHHEESNDTAIAPRVLATSPLQRKQETYDHWQEQQSTEEVKLIELLPPSDCWCLRSFGWVVVHDNEQKCDCTNW